MLGPAVKPQIELLKPWLTASPAKNYFYHLLAHIGRQVAPRRTLDAGAGRLRNMWMFPRGYVGIGLSRADFSFGLRNPPNPAVLAKGFKPEMYVMPLQEDFSFLGAFDLCVCTNTAMYVPDRDDLLVRLHDRVKRGGALLFEDKVEWLESYLALLHGKYKNLQVVYWGYQDGLDLHDDMPKQFQHPPTPRFVEMTMREMAAPNTREGHAHFLLIATGKVSDAELAGTPPPLFAVEDGILVLEQEGLSANIGQPAHIAG